MQLTVLVFSMNATYPSIWKYLEVKPNAHVAVKLPLPLDSYQIVSLPTDFGSLSWHPSKGPGQEGLPSSLQQGAICSACHWVRQDNLSQETQENKSRERQVDARFAGHSDESSLRDGHQVHLSGTWSELMALKIPPFLFFSLQHGGSGLFLESRGRFWTWN